MRWIRPGALCDGLAAAWRAALPFPHVVIDHFVLGPGGGPRDGLGQGHEIGIDALRRAVAAEPHVESRGDLFEVMASADELQHPVLRAFASELGSPATLDGVRAITGRPCQRVEVRSYVYLAGGYLLPHTDAGPDARRQVAFALYLGPEGAFAGGELELFECRLVGDEVVATRPAAVIAPRVNRLVLFDVSLRSIHQVREVTAGGRASLAGWFL